jgi:hypothetical protein
MQGSPILLSFLPELSASRGKLLSGSTERGQPVYAASFLRERRIVLESSLLERNDELRLILTHELFHFAWLRLGNKSRSGYAALLEDECRSGARCELGESSDVAKSRCSAGPKAWRNYACESFCDTAACLYAGLEAHPAFQLGKRWRKRREDWFMQFDSFRV